MALALIGGLSLGCSAPPAAPSPQSFPLGLAVSPTGTGVQWGTTFIFDATATMPAGATFQWQFGDGTNAVGPGPVSHVYTQAGAFTAQLAVSAGGQTVTESVGVTVDSLLGTWAGTIMGHTAVAPGRQALSSFSLQVFTTPNPSDRITPFGSTVTVNGRWSDNAGCVVATGSPQGTLTQTLDTTQLFGYDPSTVGVFFGIEQFLCNGSGGFLDLSFNGTADASFDMVSGTCPQGGPGCQFQMRRTDR